MPSRRISLTRQGKSRMLNTARAVFPLMASMVSRPWVSAPSPPASSARPAATSAPRPSRPSARRHRAPGRRGTRSPSPAVVSLQSCPGLPKCPRAATWSRPQARKTAQSRTSRRAALCAPLAITRRRALRHRCSRPTLSGSSRSPGGPIRLPSVVLPHTCCPPCGPAPA